MLAVGGSSQEWLSPGKSQSCPKGSHPDTRGQTGIIMAQTFPVMLHLVIISQTCSLRFSWPSGKPEGRTPSQEDGHLQTEHSDWKGVCGGRGASGGQSGSLSWSGCCLLNAFTPSLTELCTDDRGISSACMLYINKKKKAARQFSYGDKTENKCPRNSHGGITLY